MAYVIAVFIVFILSFHGALAQSEESDAIISKYFEAKGGIDQWSKLNSISKEFDHVEYRGLFVSDTSHFTIFLAKPNKYKQTEVQGTAVSILGLDGDTLWVQRNGNSSIIPDEQLSIFKSTMVIVGMEDLFLDSTADISYIGNRDFQGKVYSVLRAKKTDWLYYYDCYFNRQTNLLYCSISTHNGVVTFFKNHKWIHGLLFHFVEEVYDDMKNPISKSLYTKIEVDPQLEESIFKYPN